MARPYLYAATDEGQSAVDLFQRLNDPISREMIAPLPVDEGQSEVELFQRLNDPVPREMIAPLPVDEGQSEINLFQRLSDDAIPHEQFDIDSEPSASQPFIDSLDPVLVGSDWRLAVLLAAKLDEDVTLPTLDPAPSDSVLETSTIFIPCGDRIPEFGDVLIYAGDDPNYVLPSGVPALLDDKTIILVNDVLVYMNSTPQNGWSVLLASNLINGFDYTLTGPGGLIPVGTVNVNVYLEGVESFQDSYSFISNPRPVGGISDIFVVAKDLIKINFISSVAVVPSLFNVDNYDISGLGGAVDVNAVEVLPFDEGVRTTTYLFLRITRPTFGGDYRINVTDGVLFDPNGGGLAASAVSWTHHRTKVDTVLSSLPKMYNKSSHSVLRSILEAIMISDEEIGGDF